MIEVPKEPQVIKELREGFRLGVSVTELRENMSQIIDFAVDHDREIYITRHGTVIAKLVPYKPDGLLS